MNAPRDDLRFVRGHRLAGFAYEFPHLCPGDGCAIAEWLEGRHRRDAIVVDAALREAYKGADKQKGRPGEGDP